MPARLDAHRFFGHRDQVAPRGEEPRPGCTLGHERVRAGQFEVEGGDGQVYGQLGDLVNGFAYLISVYDNYNGQYQKPGISAPTSTTKRCSQNSLARPPALTAGGQSIRPDSVFIGSGEAGPAEQADRLGQQRDFVRELDGVRQQAGHGYRALPGVRGRGSRPSDPLGR